MFSQLGPLFKTVFRSAEHADARLEIRREEKENGRKKQDEQAEDDSTNALWEDSTAVSVIALRAFLIEFLKKNNAGDVPAMTEAVNEAEDLTAIETVPPPAPVSSVAARAVKAYTSMTTQNAYTPPPVATPPENPNNPNADLASLLAADEVRTIHRLIGELDTLSKNGVETLTILMNGTFLESVSEAIRLQKSSL